jgi:hypothetical protein
VKIKWHDLRENIYSLIYSYMFLPEDGNVEIEFQHFRTITDQCL